MFIPNIIQDTLARSSRLTFFIEELFNAFNITEVLFLLYPRFPDIY
nr:MAG TPA: cell division control protein 31 [Caudoviricetes sp.]